MKKTHLLMAFILTLLMPLSSQAGHWSKMSSDMYNSGYINKLGPEPPNPPIIANIDINAGASPVGFYSSGLYAGSSDGNFYYLRYRDAMNIETRSLFKAQAGISTSAAVKSASYIYFGSDDGMLHCVKSSTRPKSSED